MTASPPPAPARPGGRALVLATWVLLAGALCLASLPRLETPGLYYDEAFLANQARDFVEPELRGVHPPGTRALWVAGRPFPVLNVAYLGSLKSQLLIPSFALLGAELGVLRGTTLAWSALALLLAMLWARRLWGVPTAALGGLLVAADPTYALLSTLEWGPFTTGFLCRSAGLLAVTAGWTERRAGLLAAGGLAFGLGVYSRADFALFLAAAGLALLALRPALLAEALRERTGHAALGAAGLLVGAAPLLLSVEAVLAAAGAVPAGGGLAEKLRVAATMLDGSHLYRLFEAGGRFDAIGAVEGAPSALLPVALAASALGLALRSARGLGRAPGARADAFLLLAAALLAAGLLALPGAVRIHHWMGLVPLPQLVVARGALGLAGDLRRGRARPALAAALVALLLASNAWVFGRTQQQLEATGGKGRFSAAIFRLAERVRGDPPARVVALDWGFAEPLRFLAPRAELLEPIWGLRRRAARGRAWTHAGAAGALYLVHEARYDRFGLGPAFLRALRSLPGDAVALRRYRDRRGEVAFLAVELRAEHTLRWRGGRFHLSLHPSGERSAGARGSGRAPVFQGGRSRVPWSLE